MKDYKHILFDFDGTVVDTSPGVIKSAIYTLDSFGIKVDNPQVSLRKILGPPLSYTFNEFFGLEGDDLARAIIKFREYYTEKGLYDCSPYDGIDELFKLLKTHGKHIILATSKPALFAGRLLEHFNLKHYFDFISGPELDGTRSEKPEVIKYAIEQCSIDVSEAIMIGDRFYDIQGAASFGMDSIGVLYGFGEEKEFEGSVATAKDASELGRLLIQPQ
jgi:phosphoglycolate phosphatase